MHYAFSRYAHSGKERIGENTDTVFQKYQESFGEKRNLIIVLINDTN